jgi:hypothetical protein
MSDNRQAGKGDKRRPGKAYDENFDRIFGKEHKASSGRFVTDKDTGKVVEVGERQVDAKGFVIPDIEAFVSPVDGRIVNTRSELERHNREHGVTDSRDYSKEFIEKKHIERSQATLGMTKADKADRIERLRYAIDKHGIRR